MMASLLALGLAVGSADAAVLCVKKKGQVFKRSSACKVKETVMTLTDVPGSTGAQGPTGQAGADGAEGPQGPAGPAGPAGSNAFSVFGTSPIDLSVLSAVTSVAHLDLPPGNYLVMGKMVVESLLGAVVNCSLDDGVSTLDVAGLGSLLGLRPSTLISVVTLASAGGVDIMCPQALATLTGLRLTAINLETLTSTPLP